MGLSLRNAAKEAGVSKSTILRAIQSGRLSSARTPDGGYDIDPAELFRVYDPAATKRPEAGPEGHNAPAIDAAATAALEAQIEGLREIIRRADAAADEIRQDRDRWRSMAESQQRLLSDTRPKPWWKRLVG